jgi:hypothetical protein
VRSISTPIVETNASADVATIVGIAVAVAVAVGFAVAVAVADGFAVAVGVVSGVAVCVGDAEGDALAEGFGEAEAVAVDVAAIATLWVDELPFAATGALALVVPAALHPAKPMTVKRKQKYDDVRNMVTASIGERCGVVVSESVTGAHICAVPAHFDRTVGIPR